jgi:anti-sigma B factor antagonist
MDIKPRSVGRATVLDIHGQIRGSEVTEFKGFVRTCVKDGQRDLVLNLGEVQFIDSSGVGMLIHLLQEVRSQGGDIRLLNLSEDIHDLFEMVAIDRLFQILSSEQEVSP